MSGHTLGIEVYSRGNIELTGDFGFLKTVTELCKRKGIDTREVRICDLIGLKGLDPRWLNTPPLRVS